MSKAGVIKQIMNIEGTDEREATEIYNELREEIADAAASGDYEYAEDVLAEYGFEMDYIFDFI